jgi:hypothetical protein
MSSEPLQLYFSTSGANIPFVHDYEDAVAKYLKNRLRPDEMPWDGGTDSEYAATINYSPGTVDGPPIAPEVPCCGINEYVSPQGASRFGRGLFLVDKAHLLALIGWDGTGSVPSSPPLHVAVNLHIGNATIKVFALTPIEIDAAATADDRELWLVPVVDVRFFVLHATIHPDDSDVRSTTTWATLAGSLQSAMQAQCPSVGSLTLTLGSVDSAFLQPDPGYFSVARSVGYAIEHMAASVGKRVAFDTATNNFILQTQSQAQAAKPDTDKRMLGDNDGNAVGPIVGEYHIECRQLRDHYDSGLVYGEKVAASTGSGSTGAPHTISTFYLEYYGNSQDSSSLQRWTALSQAIANANAEHQLTQFCLTEIGFNEQFTQCSALDYLHAKVDCRSQVPQFMTTYKSKEVGVIPQVNICQSADVYRHNEELARLQLTATIPIGGTSGSAIIPTGNKSATNYDGTPRTITMKLMSPTSQAIASGTQLPCFYQTNAGWYAIQGEPGPPGPQAGDPWIRFRVLRPQGNRESGIWVVSVLQHLNTTNLPGWTESPITCGSEIQVHDLNHLCPDVVYDDFQLTTKCDAESLHGGSVGIAYYRTPTSSCNVPSEVYRWEVETCSQSIDEVRVTSLGCVKAESRLQPQGIAGTGAISDDKQWIRSSGRNTDFPMEFTDAATLDPHCWEVQFTNPYALTAIEGTHLILRRTTDHQTSLPTNTDSPHEDGVPAETANWYLDRVERDVYPGGSLEEGEYAKWAVFQPLDSPTASDFQGPNGFWRLLEHYEGASPQQGDDYTDPCRPLVECMFGCSCLETPAIGFFSPEDFRYYLISSASGLLGEPELKQLIEEIETDGCGFDFKLQQFYTWTCGIPQTEGPGWQPLLSEREVVTGAYRLPTRLCLEKEIIKVCDFQFADPECHSLCAPCDCEDYPCTYTYNEETGYWDATVECPDDIPDCVCQGEAPTNTPLPGEPTVVTYECGPPSSPCTPCNFCPDECAGGYELTFLNITGDTSVGRVEAFPGTVVITNHEDDCCWNLTVDFMDMNTMQTVTRTAKVCLSPTAPSPCSTGFRSLTLTWDIADAFQMQLPTALGGTTSLCNTNYGNCGGCTVLPLTPDGSNSSWDEVCMSVACCTVGSANASELVMAAMGEHIITHESHTANLKKPMPKSHKPNPVGNATLGTQFKEAYSHLFTSCGCTRDVLQVMNRWDRSKGEPSYRQVENVAKTLHKKQSASFKAKQTLDQFADEIYQWIHNYYEAKNG